MKPTILFFSFIVTFMYNVSIGQTLTTTLNSNNSQNSNNCPLMEVNIVAADNNSGLYGISYCNHGNATATNAYIELEISDGLAINQSTFPLGAISYANNKYTFHLGDVPSLKCFDFFLEIPNVSNILHCTKVHIYPDAPCKGIIDDYILHNGGGTTNNGDGGDINNTTTGTAMATDVQRTVVADAVIGSTGTTNSVYEDHVFLNNVPCWDSLLFILGNGNGSDLNNQNTTGNPPSIDVSLFEKWNTSNGASQMDITAAFALLPIDEFCYTNLNNDPNNTTISAQDAVLSLTKTDYNPNPNNSSSTNNSSNTDLINGAKETNSTLSINVSPNPFSVSTRIDIRGAEYQIIQVQILDVSGKTIETLQTQKEQPITVQRNNLSQGVYFYRLIGDQELIHTGKLVVR